MTQWLGNDPTTNVKLTGPYAGRVRVGRFIYPRHVFVAITGHAGHPDLHMHFEWRDERPEVVEISVKSKGDGRGIRNSDLELLRLDAMASDVFQKHAEVVLNRTDEETHSVWPDWDNPDRAKDRWESVGQLIEARRRRAPTSRAELEIVADVYRRHRGKGVILAVQTALEVSPRTAARRIRDARDAGLIDPEAATSDDD